MWAVGLGGLLTVESVVGKVKDGEAVEMRCFGCVFVVI